MNLSIKEYFLYLYCVCACHNFLCTMCVKMPVETRRGHQIHWDQSCLHLVSCLMCVLGTEPRFSAIAGPVVNSLKHLSQSVSVSLLPMFLRQK